MPNPNYIKGVRFERDVMKALELKGFACTRASGSHSSWDVIAYRVDQKPLFIQCKVTNTPLVAKKLLKDFRDNTSPSKYYHQALYVKTGKGMISLEEVTI